MFGSAQERTRYLQQRMEEEGIDFALLTDLDTVYYFSYCRWCSGMEFGRPVIIVVARSGASTLVIPSLETEIARAMTWIEDIRSWVDGVGGEWTPHLRHLFGDHKAVTIGVERFKTPPVVMEWLRSELKGARLVDISPVVSEMRMVKSPEEIETMRQAGQMAIAMCEAAVQVIEEGAPEYELSLAAINAGTRKAAEYLSPEGEDELTSPVIHNLQMLMSGPHTSFGHGRPTVRKLKRGDPVYMCFCSLANLRQLKVGFDREYFVGSVKDEYARMYGIALRGQEAALKAIRPGVPAEEPHKAANEVYREAGFEAGYRTGRGIGYSNLESPELKEGDRTLLQPGMTMTVDGGCTIPGFGARVGDSIVITEAGYEFLTPYPKDLRIL